MAQFFDYVTFSEIILQFSKEFLKRHKTNLENVAMKLAKFLFQLASCQKVGYTLTTLVSCKKN